ncbi:MAG: hypothetical protein U9N37_07790 [Thermodesulfobacteriota bacterium]|nr:hypothetical protein [Thermodesulfobacteriota bacterium]
MPHLLVEKVRLILATGIEIYQLKEMAARPPTLLPAVDVAREKTYFMSILDPSRVR